MPSKSSLDYLFDIRDNAQLAQQWTETQTRETFAQNRQLFYAVTRCLEIVSEATRRGYVQEVQTQRIRDAVDIPGLSKAALNVLRDTREARLMGEIQREGESYDARMRRREEMVAATWQKGRVDPHVAGELDRFMTAAGQRLGEEGERRRYGPQPAAGAWSCPVSGASTGTAWTSWRGTSPRRARQ